MKWPPVYGTVSLAMTAVFVFIVFGYGGGGWGPIWFFAGLHVGTYLLALLAAQGRRNSPGCPSAAPPGSRVTRPAPRGRRCQSECQPRSAADRPDILPGNGAVRIMPPVKPVLLVSASASSITASDLSWATFWL